MKKLPANTYKVLSTSQQKKVQGGSNDHSPSVTFIGNWGAQMDQNLFFNEKEE